VSIVARPCPARRERPDRTMDRTMTRTSMPAGGRNAIGGTAGMSRAWREISILIRIRVLFPSGGRRWRGCMPSSFRHCPCQYRPCQYRPRRYRPRRYRQCRHRPRRYRPNRGRCSRWNIGRRPKWQQCVEAVHWTCARGSSGWTGHSKTSTVPSPGLALGECPGRTVPLQPRSPNQDEFAMESAHGRSRIDGGMCGSHICIVEGCPS